MAKTIEVPGQGNVEFPDDMPDEAIGAAIRENLPNAPSDPALASQFSAQQQALDAYRQSKQPPPPPESVVDRTKRVMGEALDTAKKVRHEAAWWALGGTKGLAGDEDQPNAIEARVTPLGSLVQDVTDAGPPASAADIGSSAKASLAHTAASADLLALQSQKAQLLQSATDTAGLSGMMPNQDGKTEAQRRRDITNSPQYLDLEDRIVQAKAAMGEIGAEQADLQERNPGYRAQIGLGLTQMTTSAAPALLAGFVTKNPTVAASIMFPQQTIDSYGNLTAAGVPHERALPASLMDGVIGATSMAVPATQMFKVGSPAFTRLVRTMVASGVSNSAAEVAQTVNDHLAALPGDATSKDLLDALKEGAAGIPKTLAVSTLAGALHATVAHALMQKPSASMEFPNAAQGPPPSSEPSQPPPGLPESPAAPKLLGEPAPQIEAPKGGGAFEASPQGGTRELTQAEVFQQEQARQARAELGTDNLTRVPAGMEREAPEGPGRAQQKQQPVLGSVGTEPAKPTMQQRRELTLQKREALNRSVDEQTTQDDVEVVPGEGENAGLHAITIRGVPRAYFQSEALASQEAHALRNELPAGEGAPPKPYVRSEVHGQPIVVNAEPTQAQKSAGNYKKGHIVWQGMNIKIENPKGGVRAGIDDTGKMWEREQHADYGYISRSTAKDGEAVDVYVGPNRTARKVFVIDQLTPDGKRYDEMKAVVGVTNLGAAKRLYMKHYPQGWQGLGAITEMSAEDFKAKVKAGQTTTPIAWRASADQVMHERATPHAEALQRMAEHAGWEEEGGRLLYRPNRGPSEGEGQTVVGKTKRLPRAPWFKDLQNEAPLPGNTAGKATVEAVRKALAGEKMSPLERKHVQAMVHLRELDEEAAKREAVEYPEGMTDEELTEIERRLGEHPAERSLDQPLYERGGKNLLVQHNIQPDRLLRSLEMGGLAMPSMAVVHKQRGLTGFGGISLLGPAGMANPKEGAKVFGADIYSARYPGVELHFDTAALKRLNEALGTTDRKIYSDEIREFDDLSRHSLVAKKFLSERGLPIEERVPYGHRAALEEFTRSLISAAKPKERIFKGFTNAGNRRYVPHTVENVMREMKKGLRGGENFNYGVGSLRAHFTPKFPSVAAIKANEHRLMSSEEFERVKEDIDTEFFDIANLLAKEIGGERAEGFGWSDVVSSILTDTARMPLERALKENGYDGRITEDTREKIGDFLGKLRDLPTEYFESKLMRVVHPSEFKVAVVPDDTAAEVREALKSNGIEIRDFKAGDSEDRRRVIREAAEERNDVLFQRGEGPRAGRVSERALRARAVQLMKVFKTRPPLTVVQDYDDLPKRIRDQHVARGGQKGDMRAFITTDHTGQLHVYLIANEYHDLKDVAGSLLHEVVVHYGLRTVLSREEHGQVLDAIQKGMPGAVANQGRIEFGNQWDPNNQRQRDLAAEELVAYYAPKYLLGQKEAPQAPPHMRSLLRRIFDAIRSFVQKLFGREQGETPQDIRDHNLQVFRDLIDALYTHLKEGTRSAGANDEARRNYDVAIGERRPVQTDTPEFRQWFGDSKVVDDRGRPLVVYHGTGADISTFEAKGIRPGLHSQGLWFTRNPDYASEHATYQGGHANVLPVHLSIQNPKMVAQSQLHMDTVDELKKEGYDGAYDMETGAWIAFDPTQIKSAIGNSGAFSPSNPDITLERRTPTFFSALTRAAENVKLTKAPAPQWIATLKNTPGVKQEEIEWSGVDEWLRSLGRPATKAEVVDFLKANELQITEVVKGGPDGDGLSHESHGAQADYDTARVELHALGYSIQFEADFGGMDAGGLPLVRDIRSDMDLEADTETGEILWTREDGAAVPPQVQQLIANATHAAERLAQYGDVDQDETRYSNYTTPGGENYREVLLTLPGMGTKNIGGPIILEGNPFSGAEAAPNDVPIYQSSHWDEGNIIAHVRFNERMSFDPVQPKSGESRADSLAAHAKLLSNAVESDAFKAHGLSGLDVESRKAVNASVLSAVRDLKVREGVIASIPVDVMDDLVRAELAPKSLLNDRTMLADVLAGDLDSDVGLMNRAVSGLVRAVADFVAEDALGSANSVGLSVDDVAAVGAGNLHAGKRTLFIEEIQSDLHQAGRERGYRDGPRRAETATSVGGRYWEVRDQYGEFITEEVDAYTEAEALAEAQALIDTGGRVANDPRVPDAPFKTTWPELVMKRMIRFAAENGFDRIAWTPGDVQNERYNLERHVTAMTVLRMNDGRYGIAAVARDNGRSVTGTYTAEELPGAVGAELAQKIIAETGPPGDKKTYSGLDFSTGGSGMRVFYDQMLPSMVNKLVKRWGAKVGTTKLFEAPKGSSGPGGFGNPDNFPFVVFTASGREYNRYDNRPSAEFDAREVLAKGGRIEDQSGDPFRLQVHSVDVTPQMREAVLGGLPMFERAVERNRAKAGGRSLPGQAYDLGRRAVSKFHNGELMLSFRRVIDPSGLSDYANQAAVMTRAMLGRLAHAKHEAIQRLEQYAAKMDLLSPADQLAIIHAIETGAPSPIPAFQPAADAMRMMLDKWRDKVQSLGEGYLDAYIDNYFPHYWQDEKKAGKLVGMIAGRRPLRGPATFLKKRTIPTVKEGMDYGLRPLSTNPLILTALKLHEMQRFYTGVKLMQQFKAAGLAKFLRAGLPTPEGWTDINDAVGKVRQWSEEEGGFIERGRYLMPEDAARIINNHLSASAFRNFLPAQIFRAASNAMNALQLGFSGFHLGFTTLDAMISKNALAIERLLHGEPLRAASAFIEGFSGPLAAGLNIARGTQLLRAYSNPGGATPMLQQVVKALTAGGGRVSMDRYFSAAVGGSPFHGVGAVTLARDIKAALTQPSGKISELSSVLGHFPANYATKLWRDLQQMAVTMPVWQMPFEIAGRITRASTAIIMEKIVPMQKLGVFSDMAHDYLRRHPTATPQQLAEAMQTAWQSVDNRLGEMVYDNLFWNRTFKDCLHFAIRAVGWNYGTISELGGAPFDAAAILDKLATDKKVTAQDWGHKIPYLLAMTITTMVFGAIMNYLFTGKAPQEPKDYFFPRTGGVTKYGTPERVSMPSYAKDVYEYSQEPGTTVLNKLNPIFNVAASIWKNEDFFGNAIYDPTAEDTTQAIQTAQYLGREVMPFSLQGAKHIAGGEDDSVSGKIKTALPFIGISPAPGRVTSTEQMETAAAMRKEESYAKGLRYRRDQAKQSGDQQQYEELQRQYVDAMRRAAKLKGEVSKNYSIGTNAQRKLKEEQDAKKAEKIGALIEGKSKSEAPAALRESGYPQLASLIESMPDKPRPVVSQALQQFAEVA